MSYISDELLMAFADGELDGVQRASIESHVRKSPETAARYAVFAATGRSLAEIFELPMLEPVPQRLIDAVKAPACIANVPGPAANENVVPFARVGKAQPSAYRRDVWLAAACVSMLSVGAGAYWFFNPATSGSDERFAMMESGGGLPVAVAELASALDTAPGGTVAVRNIGGTSLAIKPIVTFASSDQGYCRQYEIARENAKSIGGVACRDNAGRWLIEKQVAFVPERSLDAGIKPAAGSEAVAAVEATVDKLIVGDVLGGDEEAALMKGGWATSAP